MNDYDNKIKDFTVKAIKEVKSQLDKQFGDDRLFGFAIGTDDDVMSIYNAACTQSWVQENSKDYESVGYIFTEWVQSGNEKLFDAAYDLILSHYEDEKHDADFGKFRDIRFESLVRALKECRDEGIFDENTLLVVGSTDPSDYLEELEMRAVDLLNNKSVADKFAKALGYSEYRI